MNQAWIAETNMIRDGISCGQRFHALKSGRRQARVNTIANALCNQNLMATFTVDGAGNRIVFETKVRNLFVIDATTKAGCRHG